MYNKLFGVCWTVIEPDVTHASNVKGFIISKKDLSLRSVQGKVILLIKICCWVGFFIF